MALTSAETTAIRLYLGYANLNRYKHTRLEGTFASLDTDGETAARSILTELAAVDAVLAAAGLTVSAQGTLKKVDEVEWYNTTTGASNGSGALARGRMLITRLSVLFGVPTYGDYFGRSGYPGDTYSDQGLSGPNASGMIPLG